MITLRDFLLSEKLITFGGKAYPKFGQMVILAGGAGSGKGFTLSKILGIEGNILDVDALKQLAKRVDSLVQRIKDKTDVDISKLNLKNPDNTTELHNILYDFNIIQDYEKKVLNAASLAPENKKPNLIFDVTLADISRFEEITRVVKAMGYKSENIHLVWVLNDFDVARKQNQGRERVVKDEILVSTHEGASLTMRKIMEMGNDVKKYMDGDIWVSFNKTGVDSTISKSKKGGSYVKDARYFQVKKKGKPAKTYKDIEQHHIFRIQNYVPKPLTW